MMQWKIWWWKEVARRSKDLVLPQYAPPDSERIRLDHRQVERPGELSNTSPAQSGPIWWSLRKGQLVYLLYIPWLRGFPGGTSGKELACQWRRGKRRRFDPWIGKIPPEKGMALHSRMCAWRIPWTKVFGGVQSIGPQRVVHNWSA